MRTTVDIDDTLLQRLLSEANRLGVPLRTLLHSVLQRGMEAEGISCGVVYRTPSVSLGHVREGVNLVKALQLSTALEDVDLGG